MFGAGGTGGGLQTPRNANVLGPKCRGRGGCAWSRNNARAHAAHAEVRTRRAPARPGPRARPRRPSAGGSELFPARAKRAAGTRQRDVNEENRPSHLPSSRTASPSLPTRFLTRTPSPGKSQKRRGGSTAGQERAGWANKGEVKDGSSPLGAPGAHSPRSPGSWACAWEPGAQGCARDLQEQLRGMTRGSSAARPAPSRTRRGPNPPLRATFPPALGGQGTSGAFSPSRSHPRDSRGPF